MLVVASPESGEASQVALSNVISETAGRFTNSFMGRPKASWRLKTDFISENWAVSKKKFIFLFFFFKFMLRPIVTGR
jgi:hypothetical protein